MNLNYRQQAISSASPLELVVTLYDGILVQLQQAMDAAERADVVARRNAVKRALDIFLHLQSRLVPVEGSQVATTLEHFYTEMFRHTLLASAANSPAHFAHVMRCVAEVRGAWRTAAQTSTAVGATDLNARASG